MNNYAQVKNNFIIVLLVLAFLAVMSVSCSGAPAGPGATTTVKTVPNETPGTIGTTTTIVTPVATATPIKTSETPAKTTATKTPAIPTPPSQQELADNGFALPWISRITCEQLKQMIDTGSDFILIDTRSDKSFKLDHLPGAIDITLNGSQPEWLNAQLAAIPEKKIAVFYCDCPDDIESATLAEKLILLRSGNQSNVKVLWKGYYRWLELGYPITK